MGVQIAAAQRPVSGERICGDAYLVLSAAGTTNVALADGLGHGPPAAQAAVAFCGHVRQHQTDALDSLVRSAHVALSSTRGAAVAVVRIDEAARRMEFCGVGNIEVACEGDANIRPFSVAGVVGKRVRRVQVFEYELRDPILLLLTSDGVSSRLDLADYAALPLHQLAERVMARHGKHHDDATCIAIRAAVGRAVAETPALEGERLPGTGRSFMVQRDSDSVWASRRAARLAEALGFERRDAWAIGIAVSELVSNAVKYAGGGEVSLRSLLGARPGLEVVVRDSGPGIPDPQAALEDGYSGGRRLTLDERLTHRDGLGLGLGAVTRLTDEVQVRNRAGGGLEVVARKWLHK